MPRSRAISMQSSSGRDVGIGVLLDGVEVDGGRVRADGVLEVLARRALVRAELDQLGSGGLQAAVVPVALPPLDEKLVLHSGGVRELLYPVVVVSGHHGGGGECQRRPRAGGHPRRGHVRHISDSTSGLLLQLDQRDVGDARRLHRLDHLRRGRRAAQQRDAADGVDDRLRSYVFVDLAPFSVSHVGLLVLRGYLDSGIPVAASMLLEVRVRHNSYVLLAILQAQAVHVGVGGVAQRRRQASGELVAAQPERPQAGQVAQLGRDRSRQVVFGQE